MIVGCVVAHRDAFVVVVAAADQGVGLVVAAVVAQNKHDVVQDVGFDGAARGTVVHDDGAEHHIAPAADVSHGEH
jgi:hypothetical protein